MTGCLSTYTNDWGVRIDSGDNAADRIAAKHGFFNKGQIGSLIGYYHFRHSSHPPRSNVSAPEHTNRLESESEVLWVEQQVLNKHSHKSIELPPSDPNFTDQWHLLNHGQLGGPSEQDINVMPVWEQGVTGQDVVVVVVDCGVQHTHPDLKKNYDASVSYDFEDDDGDPSPAMDTEGWQHGTRCAGEIAAEKNNVCGVGVAYNVKLGVIKLHDGDFYSSTDVDESKSLGYKSQTVDIYSNSWGPLDSGSSVGGPRTLTALTLKHGVKKGRGGRGNIFVFAAGNGGDIDDCNCDGYSNSIYTIAVTALSGNGTKPWYTESCTAIMATTYSGAGTDSQNITTTDTLSGCTDQHSGTSAAAPLAAGMIALALEVNPHLSWRDVQHLIVRTSSVVDAGRSDWMVNGAGLYASRSYGFGIMDAERLVSAARNWTAVGKQHVCTVAYTGFMPRDIDGDVSLSIRSTGCKGEKNEVRYLEHVVAAITLRSNYRGAISIKLKSPKGTSSNLLRTRPLDFDSILGFTEWPFMTVHNWGEDPEGTWTLTVKTAESIWEVGDYYSGYTNSNKISRWTLTLYGTKEPPLSSSRCHAQCNGCIGPGSDHCLSCLNFSEERQGTTYCVEKCSSGKIPSFTLNGRDISCVSNCKTGTFRDGDRCVPCHWGCETCSKSPLGSVNCTACRNGYLRHAETCVDACPGGYYENRELNICSSCSGVTKHCGACSASSCLSCNFPYYLEDGYCQNCPVGTYRPQYTDYFSDTGTYSVIGQSGSSCAPCDSNCNSCNATSCLSCNYPYILQNGYCTCPERTYGGSDVLCCHSSCKTCSGPSDRQCLGCYYLDILYERRCVDTCPDGTYTNSNDGTTRKSCDDCHSSCKTCTGPSDIECVSCGKRTYLRGSECEERDGKGGSNGGHIVPIVCGSLSALVIVIFAAAVIVRKCSGRGRRLGNRPWRSLVTVADDNSANTLLTTTGEESNTEQLY